MSKTKTWQRGRSLAGGAHILVVVSIRDHMPHVMAIHDSNQYAIPN